MNLTAADIVHAIGALPRNRRYHYVNPSTRTVIVIDRIEQPEGPIWIKRFQEGEQNQLSAIPAESISREMIWRIANAAAEGRPFNVDRVLGGSYNTRSALEALLAHTPEFYWCRPGRVEVINSSSTIKPGHKHLMWVPSEPHAALEITEKQTDIVISEIPNQEIVYDSLELPSALVGGVDDIDLQRRHAQIQAALIIIGAHLQYQVWVAQNDRGIKFGNKLFAEMDAVIPQLSEHTVIQYWAEAVEAARLIDCIWFRNGKLMPAVIEIEHTTGVTSGLSRMKNLHDKMPPFPTRYVIAAPDEDRYKVIQEIRKQQFADLQARYFPYSAVEELYVLCTKRKILGVSDEFLDSYMEEV